ncbi:hypothetical protein ES288_D10G200200v1 [Gossypium darwinii]|uniref:Uncharacterized protein n=1 Tax=Gossypium darwinii TaxID=34276 RepID=A0A5D2B220_GOSDA|nr:hypothetical protein ES288_D10G200200v1 [Gossypium darwinii]
MSLSFSSLLLYIFVCLSYGIDFYHYFNFYRLVASLWKIFFSHSKPIFLNEGTPLHKNNVLLVVAQLDDESM